MEQTGTKSESTKKQKAPKAKRKDLHVRISKEAHDWLKKNVQTSPDS